MDQEGNGVGAGRWRDREGSAISVLIDVYYK